MIGIDDLAQKEVAITLAAAALAVSKPARQLVRQGAVYGLAGMFVAADGVGAFARGVGRGMRGGTNRIGAGTEEGRQNGGEG